MTVRVASVPTRAFVTDVAPPHAAPRSPVRRQQRTRRGRVPDLEAIRAYTSIHGACAFHDVTDNVTISCVPPEHAPRTEAEKFAVSRNYAEPGGAGIRGRASRTRVPLRGRRPRDSYS